MIDLRCSLLIPLVLLASCTSTGVEETPHTPARDAISLASDVASLDYSPRIDRITSFRSAGGTEMLFTQRVDRLPLPDEAYTFFGGAYAWTAPQHGPAGWIGPDAEPRAWPPDPAMDIGPANADLYDDGAIRSSTPVSRLHLVENKTIRMTESGMELAFELFNAGEQTRVAGQWLNTAVHPDALIAVRYNASFEERLSGWDQTSIDRFLSIVDVQDDGWALVHLDRAEWEGGIKVYLPHDPIELPQIAIYRRGVWLHRAQSLTERALGLEGRLRALGEGPVALYIQPTQRPAREPMIIEAELYAPVQDIPSKGATVAFERWTLIESPDGPDTASLPVAQDPEGVPVPAIELGSD